MFGVILSGYVVVVAGERPCRDYQGRVTRGGEPHVARPLSVGSCQDGGEGGRRRPGSRTGTYSRSRVVRTVLGSEERRVGKEWRSGGARGRSRTASVCGRTRPSHHAGSHACG